MFPEVDCVINNAGMQKPIKFGSDEPLDITAGDAEIDTNFRRQAESSLLSWLSCTESSAHEPCSALSSLMYCTRAVLVLHKRSVSCAD